MWNYVRFFRYISPKLLVIAPDCGLGFLRNSMIRPKLTHMCTAAKMCSCGLSKNMSGVSLTESPESLPDSPLLCGEA